MREARLTHDAAAKLIEEAVSLTKFQSTGMEWSCTQNRIRLCIARQHDTKQYASVAS